MQRKTQYFSRSAIIVLAMVLQSRLGPTKYFRLPPSRLQWRLRSRPPSYTPPSRPPSSRQSRGLFEEYRLALESVSRVATIPNVPPSKQDLDWLQRYVKDVQQRYISAFLYYATTNQWTLYCVVARTSSYEYLQLASDELFLVG
jgi:hypothetical protein